MICTHYGNMDQNLRECFQYLFLFGATHPAINAMAFRFREVFLVSGRQLLPNTHILKAWHCRKRVQLRLETSNCWASKNHVRICLLSKYQHYSFIYLQLKTQLPNGQNQLSQYLPCLWLKHLFCWLSMSPFAFVMLCVFFYLIETSHPEIISAYPQPLWRFVSTSYYG